MIRFGYPLVLAAAPFVLLVLWVALYWSDRRRRRLLESFTGDPARRWSSPGFGRFRPALSRFLLLAGIAFLLLALARPLMFFRDDQHELQGIPFLIAIDASRSMLATDVKPSRYGLVTNALDKWLGEIRADRVGIVTFAGEAYLNAPLTFDTSALQTVLRYITPEEVLEGGSSLTVAIERSMKYFVSNNIPMRLLVLISDGEELEGNGIEAARRARRQSGMTVCAIGVGTSSGAKVPARRQNWEQPRTQKNTFGQEVVSRMDEGNLKRIANAGGGRYFPLGQNGEGLKQLRDLVLRPLAEAAAKDDLQNYREVFQIPLSLALIGLAAGLLFRADHAPRRAATAQVAAARI